MKQKHSCDMCSEDAEYERDGIWFCKICGEFSFITARMYPEHYSDADCRVFRALAHIIRLLEKRETK